MSCEEAWNRVRQLAGQSANAHQAYATLVKALPLTTETSVVIVGARERYKQADDMLCSARQTANRAQEQH